jgi:hypothetical protein
MVQLLMRAIALIPAPMKAAAARTLASALNLAKNLSPRDTFAAVGNVIKDNPIKAAIAVQALSSYIPEHLTPVVRKLEEDVTKNSPEMIDHVRDLWALIDTDGKPDSPSGNIVHAKEVAKVLDPVSQLLGGFENYLLLRVAIEKYSDQDHADYKALRNL